MARDGALGTGDGNLVGYHDLAQFAFCIVLHVEKLADREVSSPQSTTHNVRESVSGKYFSVKYSSVYRTPLQKLPRQLNFFAKPRRKITSIPGWCRISVLSAKASESFVPLIGSDPSFDERRWKIRYHT
jgi:hypothetical protein